MKKTYQNPAGVFRHPGFTRVVTVEELRSADPELESLKNFNSPSEYDALLARLAGGGTAGAGLGGGTGGGQAGSRGGSGPGGPG